MAFPARLLNPGEDVVVDVRPHWWYLSKPVAASVVVLAGAVAAAIESAPSAVAFAVVAVLAATLAWLLLRYARWSTTRLVVTTNRLVHRSGLLTRRGREIPLDHLSDITCRQSVLQRLVGAGDLLLESAGKDSAETFPWLPHPGGIQNEIYRQIDALHSRRPAGSALSVPEQLEKLDELRRRGVLTQGEFDEQKARLLGQRH
jgi:membrane protein YdbS with pleckstrin-like domain